MILNLARPQAEITNAIAENLTTIDTKEKYDTCTRFVEVEKIPIDCAHEVCTSQHCIKYIVECDKRRIHYKCIKIYDSYRTKSLFCEDCSCKWSFHKEITYETLFIVTHLEHQRVDVEEMRAEQATIKKTRAQFASYLKMNATKPYNDTIHEYLKYFIDTRENTDRAVAAISKMFARITKTF